MFRTNIWNYGGGCCGEDRSTKDLGVDVSIDGVTFLSISDFVLNQSNTDPIAKQTILLDTTARFVRFNLNSNYGSSEFIGLSEVQFESVVVSTPTNALMLVFGLAGLVLFKKITVAD